MYILVKNKPQYIHQKVKEYMACLYGSFYPAQSQCSAFFHIVVVEMTLFTHIHCLGQGSVVVASVLFTTLQSFLPTNSSERYCTCTQHSTYARISE